MNNLLVIHLESISNQTFRIFNNAFPVVNAFFNKSIFFERFFSSATSSLMIISSVWHGNSFEFDHSDTLMDVMPAGLNRNLFVVLNEKGYNTRAFCLNMKHRSSGTQISIWPDGLEPVWGTDNTEHLLEYFKVATAKEPFALYWWNLLTHISQNGNCSTETGSLTEQTERSYRISDALIGDMLKILEEKDLLKNTVIVLFGDHGDDFWVHGFKGGYVHATEPYTSITATPMGIYSPDVQPFRYIHPASTVDIRNTVLGLLQVPVDGESAYSGINLLRQQNEIVFSQSLLANQMSSPEFPVDKSYCAINGNYILLATQRGLALYNHLLDPSNGCNLLHFFSMDKGALCFRYTESTNEHMRDIFLERPQNILHIQNNFIALKQALSLLIRQKNSFACEEHRFPLDSLEKIDRKGYYDFYGFKEDQSLLGVLETWRRHAGRFFGK